MLKFCMICEHFKGGTNNVYMYLCIYIYMYVCMHVCMYVCTYVRMYVYMDVCK